MKILAMDTSNKALSVAITAEDQIIAEVTTNVTKNHSVRLMPAVQYVMKEAGMKPEELDRIAVAKGPGSYTGVRIGLATAKSLAWALNIPVVGVSSLEVAAYQGHLSKGIIVPFFDARRGLVFTGAYQWDQNQLSLVAEERNQDMQAWLTELNQWDSQIVFLSPDMGAFQSLITEQLGKKAVIPKGPSHIARAAHLAVIAKQRTPDHTHGLTPNYLRLAEAEAKWLEAQKDRPSHG
nr:tRNA (adenosine(37)-N6)-threonylcarbamoyltransferase complex dimerization subunit type 1 TsaB [Lentibacillus sp. JNUCC-1]